MVTEEAIKQIVGHEFPGGEYTIEHWENFLLTGCTGAELMRDGVVHPVALFHTPMIGCGTSIAEMFKLGQAESDLSIMIESYDWEMICPLQEDITYAGSGSVTSAERCKNEQGKTYDRIQFCFELRDPAGVLVARTTITWHYTRGIMGEDFASRDTEPQESASVDTATDSPAPQQSASVDMVTDSPAQLNANAPTIGEKIPQWVMERVTPERMCTMAAILRDPNPLHWDRKAVAGLGFGKRTINQGPLGLSYMINMLHAWAGENSIRHILMRFPSPILFDEDRIVAHGVVSAVRAEGGSTLVDCDIWLERDGEGGLMEGTATVCID